jgi:hypothetical protein
VDWKLPIGSVAIANPARSKPSPMAQAKQVKQPRK